MKREIEDKEKISFMNKLKEIRKTLGVSRNVFAREVEIDVTHYMKVEEGETLPDYLFLKKIIHKYRISPYFLFDFQEELETGVNRLEEEKSFVRFFIQLKAQYSLKEREGLWEECTILDVNPKGMGIEFSKEISLGTTIHLAVYLPEESEPLNVKGVLKWTKQSVNRFIGDIELTEILDENKIFTILRVGRCE